MVDNARFCDDGPRLMTNLLIMTVPKDRAPGCCVLRSGHPLDIRNILMNDEALIVSNWQSVIEPGST
jgi:hypothetical protein